MTVRRYGLRDDQWERISELLPGRKGQVGRPAQDNRRFVEAVLYRYRAGIAWRDLPIDAFPDVSSTQVKIILKAPGMTPEEVETRLAVPVEQATRAARLRHPAPAAAW